jgi:hypothetical protein
MAYKIEFSDEGDREALALKSNPEFMAFLSECQDRARARPRKSLKEIRTAFESAGEE